MIAVAFFEIAIVGKNCKASIFFVDWLRNCWKLLLLSKCFFFLFFLLSITLFVIYLWAKAQEVFRLVDIIPILFFIFMLITGVYALKFCLLYVRTKYTDIITNGLNENQFIQAFEDKLKINHHQGFMVINIKKFSTINSKYGYEIGDDVLKKVYEAMKSTLFEGELICRNQADNFYVLVDAKDSDEAIARMLKLDDAVYFLNDLKIKEKVFLSVGIYLIDSGDEEFSHVVECANFCRLASLDINDENTNYELYGVTIQDHRKREKQLESRAYPALKHHDFKLYLQPKYELKHESLIEAEALVRWIDSKEGMIPLNEFIPLFERNGFMRQVDYFIFDETLKLFQKWIDEGIESIKISANLSKSHFTEMSFFEKRFIPILNRYHVPKSYIEFEISENAMLDNEEKLIQFVKSLKEQGFDCSMDDFGSGYSSLNPMKSLPVSVIKLIVRCLAKKKRNVEKSSAEVSLR